MTQVLVLLHHLVFHFTQLGQTSHVFTFPGAGDGPWGGSETPAASPPRAAGLFPRRGLPTAAWGGTGQKNTSSVFVLAKSLAG